jgi:serine protease Do
MKQYLLKISGLAAIAILSYSPVFSQQGDDQDSAVKKIRHNAEEIIIKSKNDKNVKLSVEIRDGQVFINDKPMSEFKDDNVVVRKMRTMNMDMDGGAMALLGDVDGDGDFKTFTAPRSPFRNRSGAYSFSIGDGNGAFLGVSSEKGDDDIAGAKIRQVTKGSGAEKAGLKPGDVITRVNETAISDPEDLTGAIHKLKPEDKVNLTFKRDGKEEKVVATLGKMKEGSDAFGYGNAMPKMDDFNFNMPRTLRVSPRVYAFGESRPKLGIRAQDTEDGKGVKVLDIDEESPAEKAGIKEGDIITRFDGKEVNSATELADLARAGKDKADLKVSLTHDGKSREVDIKIPKKLKTADL